jgi:hypothetical protein
VAIEGVQKLISMLGGQAVDALVMAAALSLVGMLFLLARVGVRRFAKFAATTPNKLDDEIAADVAAGLDAAQGGVQDAIRSKK